MVNLSSSPELYADFWNPSCAQYRSDGSSNRLPDPRRPAARSAGPNAVFLTKGRRYSVTFTALRQARITYQRHQESGPDYTPFERQNEVDTESAAIVVRLSYSGTGWRTFGDALLANTAADQARKRRQVAREELAGEYTEAFAGAAA